MERRRVVTVTDALQFYPLLAGLIGLAFWSGVLTQKVRSQGSDIEALKDEEGQNAKLIERLVRLEVQMGHVEDGIGRINRGMDVMQRQLGNLMTGGGGKVIELGGGS